MILATEEDTATLKVITATTNMILATEKNDHSHFKRCLIHYKSDLGHWRSDHSHFERYISHYLSDLRPIRSDHILLSNYLSHYKGDLGH